MKTVQRMNAPGANDPPETKRPKLSRSMTVRGISIDGEGKHTTEAKTDPVDPNTDGKEAKHTTAAKEDKQDAVGPSTNDKRSTTEAKDDNPDFSFVWVDHADLMEGLEARYRGQGTGLFNSPTEPGSSQDSQA